MDSITLLLISIITYLFMAVTMYQLGLYSNQKEQIIGNKAQAYNNVYLLASLFFFAMMCGLRYRCGTDCESYASIYERLSIGLSLFSTRESVEPMFEYITRFLAWFGVGRVIYMGVWALMEISFFYLALRTRSFLLPFIGLILILGPHFCSWNNGIRQTISSCIFVYALVGILDGKKLWTYFSWITIAFFMHKSSLLLFPLFLLKYYNKDPKVFRSVIVLSICVYAGQTGIFDFIFNHAEHLLTFVGYDSYAEKFDFIMDEEASIKSYGPRRITLIISYFMIIFFSKKMDAFYSSDQLFRISFLMFMIYACATELVIGHTSLLTRPFLYFMPFLLICSGYLLNYLKKTSNVIWYGVAFMVLCSFSLISSFAVYRIPEEVALYKFIFLK